MFSQFTFPGAVNFWRRVWGVMSPQNRDNAHKAQWPCVSGSMCHPLPSRGFVRRKETQILTAGAHGRKCLVGLRERRGFLCKLYGHSQSKVCTPALAPPPSYSAERDVLIVLKIVLAPLKRLKLLGDLCKGDFEFWSFLQRDLSSVIRVCLNVKDNFLRTTCKIYNGSLRAHKLSVVYNWNKTHAHT